MTRGMIFLALILVALGSNTCHMGQVGRLCLHKVSSGHFWVQDLALARAGSGAGMRRTASQLPRQPHPGQGAHPHQRHYVEGRLDASFQRLW